MKLAIVTVTYNDSERLSSTYYSLLQQNKDLFAWYIIDGASNDGTLELVQSFSDLRPKFYSEPDKGIYDAMNKGIRLADDDYIMFLNSGDTLATPYILDRILDILDDCPSHIHIFSSLRLSSSKIWIREAPVKKLSSIIYGMPSSHQSFIYSLEYMKLNPFSDSYRIVADYAHLASAYIANQNISLHQVPLSVFVQDGLTYTKDGQLSARPELYQIRICIFGFSPAAAILLEYMDRAKMKIYRFYCFMRDFRCLPNSVRS